MRGRWFTYFYINTSAGILCAFLLIWIRVSNVYLIAIRYASTYISCDASVKIPEQIVKGKYWKHDVFLFLNFLESLTYILFIRGSISPQFGHIQDPGLNTSSYTFVWFQVFKQTNHWLIYTLLSTCAFSAALYLNYFILSAYLVK